MTPPASAGPFPPIPISVATYHAAEADGLIFVHSAQADEAPPPLPPVPEGGRALRSLILDIAPERVAALLAREFAQQADAVFAGTLAGAEARLYLQPFTSTRTALHLVLAGAGNAAAVSAAAEALRNRFEASPELEAAE
jgi:hypothetical protein